MFKGSGDVIIGRSPWLQHAMWIRGAVVGMHMGHLWGTCRTRPYLWLTVWPSDQHHGHPQGGLQKCRISGAILDIPNHDPHFPRFPGDVYVHWYHRCATIGLQQWFSHGAGAHWCHLRSLSKLSMPAPHPGRFWFTFKLVVLKLCHA